MPKQRILANGTTAIDSVLYIFIMSNTCNRKMQSKTTLLFYKCMYVRFRKYFYPIECILNLIHCTSPSLNCIQSRLKVLFNIQDWKKMCWKRYWFDSTDWCSKSRKRSRTWKQIVHIHVLHAGTRIFLNMVYLLSIHSKFLHIWFYCRI